MDFIESEPIFEEVKTNVNKWANLWRRVIPFKHMTENHTLMVLSGMVAQPGFVAQNHVESYNHFVNRAAHEIIQEWLAYNYVVQISPREAWARMMKRTPTAKPFLGFLKTTLQSILASSGRQKDLYYSASQDEKSKARTKTVHGQSSCTLPCFKIQAKTIDIQRTTMNPMECLKNKTTYSTKVYVTFERTIERKDCKVDEKMDVASDKSQFIGEFPVLVGSCKCATMNEDGTRKSEEELVKMGWDPTDHGGYYIINGQKKYIEFKEKRPNEITVRVEDEGGVFTEMQTKRKTWNGREWLDNFHIIWNRLAGPLETDKRQARYQQRVFNTPNNTVPAAAPEQKKNVGFKKSRTKSRKEVLPRKDYDINDINDALIHEMKTGEEATDLDRYKGYSLTKQMLSLGANIPWLTVQVHMGQMRFLSLKWFMLVSGIRTKEQFVAAVSMNDPPEIVNSYRAMLEDSWDMDMSNDPKECLQKLGQLWSSFEGSATELIGQGAWYLKHRFSCNYPSTNFTAKILAMLHHVNIAVRVASGVMEESDVRSFTKHGMEGDCDILSASFRSAIQMNVDVIKAQLKFKTAAFALGEPLPIQPALMNKKMVGFKSAKQEKKSWKGKSSNKPSEVLQRVAPGLNQHLNLSYQSRVTPDSDVRTKQSNKGSKKKAPAKITHQSLYGYVDMMDTPHNGPLSSHTKSLTMCTRITREATSQEEAAIDAEIKRFLEPYSGDSVPNLSQLVAGQNLTPISTDFDMVAEISAQRPSNVFAQRVRVQRANRYCHYLGVTTRPQELEDALIDMKRHCLSNDGISQMAVVWDVDNRIMTIHTSPGRLVKPVFFLDRVHNLPVIPPELQGFFDKDTQNRKKDVSFIRSLESHEYQQYLRRLTSLLWACGCLMWMDVREQNEWRVADTIAVLTDDSKEAVADRKRMRFKAMLINPLQNFSLLSAAIFGLNNNFASRLISQANNYKQSIGWDSSHMKLYGNREYRAFYPQRSLCPGIFENSVSSSLGSGSNMFVQFLAGNGKNIEDGEIVNRTVVRFAQRFTMKTELERTTFLNEKDMLAEVRKFMSIIGDKPKGKVPPTNYLIGATVDLAPPDLNKIGKADVQTVLQDTEINPYVGVPDIGLIVERKQTVVAVHHIPSKSVKESLAETQNIDPNIIAEKIKNGDNPSKVFDLLTPLNKRGTTSQFKRTQASSCGEITDNVLTGQPNGKVAVRVTMSAEVSDVIHKVGDKDQFGGQKGTISIENESSLPTNPHGITAELIAGPACFPTRKTFMILQMIVNWTKLMNPDLILKTTGRPIGEYSPFSVEHKYNAVTNRVIRKIERPALLKNLTIADMRNYLVRMQQSLTDSQTRLPYDHTLVELLAINRTPNVLGWSRFEILFEDAEKSCGISLVKEVPFLSVPEEPILTPGILVACASRHWRLKSNFKNPALDQVYKWSTSSVRETSFAEVWDSLKVDLYNELVTNMIEDWDVDRKEAETVVTKFVALTRARLESLFNSVIPDKDDCRTNDAEEQRNKRVKKPPLQKLEEKTEQEDTVFMHAIRELFNQGIRAPGFETREEKEDFDMEIQLLAKCCDTHMYLKPSGKLQKGCLFGPLAVMALNKLAAFLRKSCSGSARDVFTHQTTDGVKIGYMERDAFLQVSAIIFQEIFANNSDKTRIMQCLRCKYPLCILIRNAISDTNDRMFPWCPRCAHNKSAEDYLADMPKFVDISTTYAVEQFIKMLDQMGKETVLTTQDEPDMSVTTGFRVPKRPQGFRVFRPKVVSAATSVR